MDFISKIKFIIIHYLFENPIKIINISSLIDELTSLNKLIENFDLEYSSKKLEYKSKLDDNIGGFIKNKNKKNIKNSLKTRKNKYNKKQKTLKIK